MNSERRRMQRIRYIAVAIVAVIVTACSDDPVGPGRNLATDIAVTSSVTGAVDALGDVVELAVNATDSRGRALHGALVEWTVDGDALEPEHPADWVDGKLLAPASAVLRMRSVTDGEAHVTATVYSVSPAATATAPLHAGSVTVTVAQAVASVEVTPPQRSLWAIGERAKLEARAIDRNGNAMVKPVDIVWSSSQADVATVNEDGVVTAVKDGITSITARAGGIESAATIGVSASMQFSFCAEFATQNGGSAQAQCADVAVTAFAQSDGTPVMAGTEGGAQ